MAKKKSKTGNMTAEQCAAAIKTCACSQFRMAGRALTSRFDEALQPVDLRATQLVILLAIEAAETPTIARVARQLVMDPSTLSRNLRPLEEKGVVSIKKTPDGRSRVLAITAKGRTRLNKAVPLWKNVQTQLVDQIGEERFEDMLSGIGEIVHVTRQI